MVFVFGAVTFLGAIAFFAVPVGMRGSRTAGTAAVAQVAWAVLILLALFLTPTDEVLAGDIDRDAAARIDDSGNVLPVSAGNRDDRGGAGAGRGTRGRGLAVGTAARAVVVVSTNCVMACV